MSISYDDGTYKINISRNELISSPVNIDLRNTLLICNNPVFNDIYREFKNLRQVGIAGFSYTDFIYKTAQSYFDNLDSLFDSPSFIITGGELSLDQYNDKLNELILKYGNFGLVITDLAYREDNNDINNSIISFAQYVENTEKFFVLNLIANDTPTPPIISCDGATNRIDFSGGIQPNGLIIEVDGNQYDTGNKNWSYFINTDPYLSTIINCDWDGFAYLQNKDTANPHRIKFTSKDGNPVYFGGESGNPTFIVLNDGSIGFCLSAFTDCTSVGLDIPDYTLPAGTYHFDYTVNDGNTLSYEHIITDDETNAATVFNWFFFNADLSPVIITGTNGGEAHFQYLHSTTGTLIAADGDGSDAATITITSLQQDGVEKLADIFDTNILTIHSCSLYDFV